MSYKTIATGANPDYAVQVLIPFMYNYQVAKKKIIVTEDDPGLQDIFDIILRKAGYEVELISDGSRLLKNDFNLPDLFLLDRQLSGYDGIDICIHLKQQKQTSHIPVIMVSANPAIAQLSEKAGADAYVEKPFEINYLVAMIEKALLKDQATA